MSLSTVEDVLRRRSSIRAYLPDPIPRPTIEELLSLARLAPSGANLQPGGFHVLTGVALQSMQEALSQAVAAGRPEVSEYSYFPDSLSPELKARQRAAGYSLYSALGIGRRDIAARREQFQRNYRFFDAPVGIIVTIQRDMGKGCFMDLGMALMALFLAAESRDLGASGIGALANHADVIHETLGLDASEMVVCGIAIGKTDRNHAVNAVRTEREQIQSFAQFHGFDK